MNAALCLRGEMGYQVCRCEAMIVGVDGGCWKNKRGYGRFTRELLSAIAEIDRTNHYKIFLDADSFADFPTTRNAEPIRVDTSAPVTKAASAGSRRTISDLLRMTRAVARERLDAFLFPSVYSFFPLHRLLRSSPTVVLGIHDAIADRNPQFSFASSWEKLGWSCKVRLAIAQADRVFTVSEHSRRCLAERFGIDPAAVRVIPEAASAGFRPAPPSDGPKPPGMPQTGPYILYVGGISPNKNLTMLVRAFAIVRERLPGTTLVLAGDRDADGFRSCTSEVEETIRQYYLEGSVVWTGWVSDDALRSLYSGTSLFALPSLDEGFGLPALEAMACGAPVVVSSGNALAEVVGSAGLVVDPHDRAGLAAAMERVLTDAALAAELRARALARAREFSWQRTAQQVVELLEEAAASRASA